METPQEYRTATERRNELIKQAQDLMDEMRKITGPCNIIAARLDHEIGLLSVGATQEAIDRLTNKTGRRAPRVDVAIKNTPEGPKAVKGKRACSKCRQPGHRSTTCNQR
jgi:hypothetical protein